MQFTIDSAKKLFVLFVIQTVAVILALAFLVFWQVRVNNHTAENQLRATQISVNATRCAMVQVVQTEQHIARNLGIPVTIARLDVSDINCDTLLNREAP